MQQMRVWFLGCKDPLEKKMTSNSSILAWEILWTKEPSRFQSMGLQKVSHNLSTKQQQQQQTMCDCMLVKKSYCVETTH